VSAKAKKKETHLLKGGALNMRIKPKDKRLIEAAASVAGVSATAFVLEHAIKAARIELATVEQIALSRQDAEMFLNLLANPPPPNQAMHDLFADYEKSVVNHL